MLNILINRLPPLIRLSDFPIEGIFREPILMLEGIVILLCIQYGLYLFYKFVKEESDKNYMIRAWSIFFLTYPCTVLFFMISDFFSPLPNIRQIYIDIGYIVSGIGGLFFSYNAEREIQQKNHIFTIIIASLLGFLILDTILFIITPGIVAILTNAPFVLLLIKYIFKFTSIIKEKWRLNIYGFLIGFCIWITGYFLVSDVPVGIFGHISRFIGDFLVIIGISLISLLFVGLPSLTEFEWPNKIRKIFIMHSSGTYIADYNFQEEVTDEIKDMPQLITDGLKGINSIITNIVQSEQKMKIMDHKDVKILFEYGNYIVSAIIVDEDLEIYRTKLKKLIEYLETLYESLLPKWDGDLSHFKIIEPIIKRYFKY